MPGSSPSSTETASTSSVIAAPTPTATEPPIPSAANGLTIIRSGGPSDLESFSRTASAFSLTTTTSGLKPASRAFATTVSMMVRPS